MLLIFLCITDWKKETPQMSTNIQKGSQLRRKWTHMMSFWIRQLFWNFKFNRIFHYDLNKILLQASIRITNQWIQIYIPRLNVLWEFQISILAQFYQMSILPVSQLSIPNSRMGAVERPIRVLTIDSLGL